MHGGESGEEGTEDLTREGEGQDDSGTAAVESSCQTLKDLSLREVEGEGEEEVQGEQEDLRSPQGRLSQSASLMYTNHVLFHMNVSKSTSHHRHRQRDWNTHQTSGFITLYFSISK